MQSTLGYQSGDTRYTPSIANTDSQRVHANLENQSGAGYALWSMVPIENAGFRMNSNITSIYI